MGPPRLPLKRTYMGVGTETGELVIVSYICGIVNSFGPLITRRRLYSMSYGRAG